MYCCCCCCCCCAAERTLDIYTAGVLSDAFSKTPPPPQEWRSAMKHMSEVSCDKYRSVVRHEPTFVPYFRASTPELELGECFYLCKCGISSLSVATIQTTQSVVR
jgi:phosphoenolpyruvate carboxylase